SHSAQDRAAKRCAARSITQKSLKRFETSSERTRPPEKQNPPWRAGLAVRNISRELRTDERNKHESRRLGQEWGRSFFRSFRNFLCFLEIFGVLTINNVLGHG